jgi:hypothetical protein
MLGAAALVAEAVKSGELASARNARALIVPAALSNAS